MFVCGQEDCLVAGRLLADNLGLRYSLFFILHKFANNSAITALTGLTLDFGKLARFQVCKKTYSGMSV